MEPSRIQAVRSTLENFLSVLGISYEAIEDLSSDDLIRFNISTKESRILIGARGETVSALNHIIKKIASKSDEGLRISIDANNYLESNNQTIRNKVFILAERAKSFKTEVEMEPMTAYERMVVHAFLASDPHLETGSIGEGKNRRVVIRYKE